MLIAIKLQLQSQADAAVPAQTGRASFAALLDRLEREDQALARAVHDAEGIRPLTCSGLLGKPLAVDSRYLRRGEQVALRFTGLTAEVAAALYKVLVDEPPSHWSIQRAPLAVMGVTWSSAADPWCGRTDYARLMAEAVVGPSKHVLRLEFATATAFRSGGMTMPLPLPALVFGSLLDRWNAFSPMPLHPEMRRVAQEEVAISQVQLASVPVEQKGRSLQIGTVGNVTYTYLGREEYWLHQLRILAAFAVYSGIGIKTTMGMGQCRWYG